MHCCLCHAVCVYDVYVCNTIWCEGSVEWCCGVCVCVLGALSEHCIHIVYDLESF